MVLKLVIVAIVSSMVSINTSVKIVVISMIFTSEVTMVTQVWLMSLQVPVSSIEVSEGVRVISVHWNGMVWVLMGVVLIWSQIVMWNIPSSHIISMVSTDWVVVWSSVHLSTKWIIGVVVSSVKSMDIVVSSEVLSILLSLWLCWTLWLCWLFILWLRMLVLLKEVNVVRVSISV